MSEKSVMEAAVEGEGDDLGVQPPVENTATAGSPGTATAPEPPESSPDVAIKGNDNNNNPEEGDPVPKDQPTAEEELMAVIIAEDGLATT